MSSRPLPGTFFQIGFVVPSGITLTTIPLPETSSVQLAEPSSAAVILKVG